MRSSGVNQKPDTSPIPRSFNGLIRRCRSAFADAQRNSRSSVRSGAEAGFTLLEILVVIAILGLLIGLVAPAVLRQLGGAKVSIAKQSIERLGSVLDMYRLDNGDYPSTEQGLKALVSRPPDAPNWNGPYTSANTPPIDAWNHAYVYTMPSSRPGHPYDLCSLGPNANGNAAGQDGMICNP
jgi:general secretion pathway protein G